MTAPERKRPKPPSIRTEWERQPGETPKAFRAFCIYRDLGPERSIRLAAETFLGNPQAETRQRRRFLSHPNPSKYVRGVKRSWEVWSRRHRWVERSFAFDEHVEYVRRKSALEDELQRERTERDLRLTEARGARTAGRELLRRFLAMIDAGHLDDVRFERLRTVTITRNADGEITRRQEVETKGLVDFIELALRAIAEGQRLERLELGEVTSREETVLSTVVLERLANVIRKHVPEAEWPAVLTEFDAALRPTRGEG